MTTWIMNSITHLLSGDSPHVAITLDDPRKAKSEILRRVLTGLSIYGTNINKMEDKLLSLPDMVLCYKFVFPAKEKVFHLNL